MSAGEWVESKWKNLLDTYCKNEKFGAAGTTGEKSGQLFTSYLCYNM